jgi:hypothetical protein
MTKEDFLAKIVAENHPIYSKNKVLAKNLIKRPKDYNLCGLSNCEGLIESTIRILGKFKYCNIKYGQDLSDKSDIKTASIGLTPLKPNCNTYRASISGVCSNNGTFKSGALRVIYWNPHYEKGHFIYIPFKAWKEKSISKHGAISAAYNLLTDDFPTWSEYYGCVHFENIKELAKYKE